MNLRTVIAVAVAAGGILRAAAEPRTPQHPAPPSDPPAPVAAHDRSPALAAVAVVLIVALTLAALLALLSTASRSPSPAATVSPAQLWSARHAAAATISAGTTTLGSGFLHTSDTVLTAAHIINDSPLLRAGLATGNDPALTVTFGNGHTSEATLTDLDTVNDVAVLTLATPPDGVAAPDWATSLPQVGTPVAIIGTPTGTTQMMTTGTITGWLTDPKWNTAGREDVTAVTDAAVNPGMSGAPLFLSDGTVAGMVTARPDTLAGRRTEGFATAIPSPVLAGVLDRFANPTGPARLGATVTNTPDGVTVTGKTGGAYTSPLAEGDIIETVNGQPTPTAADLLAALATVDGDTVKVGVRRNGTPVIVTVSVLRTGTATTPSTATPTG